MPKPIERGRPYHAGIDGLRAVAVIAVITFHLGFAWAQGGLLGVTIFFVLSGYLITDLLLAQWNSRGTIDLRTFWLRRARRLLPALWTLLLCVFIWIVIIDPQQLLLLRGDLVAAVFYVSNWWFILHHVSYFVRFGPPSPLGHLWSLAVEEQFYLVWPPLLLVAMRVLRTRWRLIAMTVVLASASAIEMALLRVPGADPTRIYDGTDTRAFSLLIGAALAMLLPSQPLVRRLGIEAQRRLDVVGAFAVAMLVIMVWRTNEYQAFLYPYGMVIISLVAAVLVAVLILSEGWVSKVFGSRPLKWVGVRSYGIYLWHYPVIVLTTPAQQTGDINGGRVVLQVAASFLLAGLSWKYIEDPIRRGGLRSLAKSFEAWRLRQRRPQFVLWGGLTSTTMLLATVAFGFLDPVKALSVSTPISSITPGSIPFTSLRPKAYGPAYPVNTTPASSSPGPSVTTAQATTTTAPALPGQPATSTNLGGVTAGVSLAGSGQAGATSTSTTPTSLIPSDTTPSTTANGGALGTCVPSDPGGPTVGADGSLVPQAGSDVTVIGDSLSIDVAPYLERLLPGVVVDAAVGRQLVQAQAIVSSLQAAGNLRTCVVIALGTNGPFSAQQLSSLISSLGSGHRVILVTTRVPRPWQDSVNATIESVATSTPSVTVFDWYALSASLSNFFYPDGVHLDPSGASIYANDLARLLEGGTP